jgi:hypothetical protein
VGEVHFLVGKGEPVKEIPLTQGQVALVDDDDFERLNAFKWQAQWMITAKSFYAVRFEGGRKNRRWVSMSRFIMHTPKGMECDHINHDTLDDRKCNLKNCTRSQNQQNRKIYIDRVQIPNKNNKIGFINVAKHSKYGYVVSIQRNKKTIYHKWFLHLEEAITARDEVLNKYSDDFSSSGDKPSEDIH